MQPLICLLLAMLSMQSMAALFDELPDLQGKTVIFAGEFESVFCPVSGKYDCMSWPIELLKSKSDKEICIKPTSSARCSSSCKGLIAVGEDKIPYLYIFGRMGSDLAKSRFEVYKCPSMY